MKFRIPLHGPSAVLPALLAGTAGFAVNLVGLPIFGGTEIVFGSAFTLLATYLLGPWWGLFSTLIAYSSTVVTWGHGWGLMIFGLEAFVIGWLHSRRGLHPLKGFVAFWVPVGVPLSICTILGQTDYPFPTYLALPLKYPINSLVTAMLALPVFYARPFRRLAGLPLDRDAHTPLRRVLFLRLGLTITLAIAAFGLFAGGAFDRALRESARQALANDGRAVAVEVEEFLDNNQRAIEQLANTLDVADGLEAGEDLASLQSLNPSFLTLLTTDAEGRIIAAFPSQGRGGRPLAGTGMKVADRPYFLVPRNTGRPFVSDVFRGRGFGRDLIVAMSAPMIRQGRFTGIVEGSLNLSTLTDSISRSGQLHERTVIIVDRSGRVVAGRGRTHVRALQQFSRDDLYFDARESGEETYLTDNTETARPEQFIATRQVVPRFGWQVYLAEPVWRTQATIANFYLATAVVAAAAIGLSLLLARGTAAEITDPLSQLVAATRRLSHDAAAPAPAEATHAHASKELTEISHELSAATATLSRANRELASAVADRDRTHEQLRLVLVGLEDKIRERTRELDEARRSAESASEAKSEFLASMSHELRTPLNVIVGMSELIGEKSLGPLNDRQAEGLQNINESGRHLLELINDILDLSKIEAGMLELHPQPMEVDHVCRASLRFIQEAARKKNLRIESRLLHTSETVMADERRLKQVLVNLLANAVKFTPAGGSVGLDVREDAQAHVLRFEVWDTGIGISPEDFERIFNPFEQIDSSLSRQYAGTGLGLALVRRMTELHGGRVDLESETGKGSRFCVSIPLILPDAPAPAPVEPAVAQTAPPIASRLRILIAEDNEANHQVYAAFFAHRGCELLIARDGAEAVAIALRERPDLAIMDVQMPVMDGIDAMRKLRADTRTERMPIIAVTALAMPDDRLRCLEAGANAYLSKPINLRELGRQIARLTAEPAATPAPVA